MIDGVTRRGFIKFTAAASLYSPLSVSATPVVGLIFPSLNRMIPPDAQTLYPGIRFIAQGIGLGRTLPEDFDRLIERVVPMARSLFRQGANALVLMAPPLSFYQGADFNRRLTNEMARATGLQSITASTAIVEGLKSVRARRLAVATVYTEEISLHLQGFLEEHGFEVVTVRALGIERFEEREPVTAAVTNQEFLEFCIDVRESRPEADALLICSGYLNTLEFVAPLEKRCRIPVVNATPHSLRAGVQLAGARGRRSDFGALLDSE